MSSVEERAAWTKHKLVLKTATHGVLSADSLQVTSSSSRSDTVILAHANQPWPTIGSGYRYFEMKIITAGSRGIIGLGFIPQGYDEDSMPGWHENSIGYHADDAGVFQAEGRFENSIPPIWNTNGAVAGCGIDYLQRTVFFTREGKRVGESYKLPTVAKIYPAIGMRSSGEKGEVNFGAKPFLYEEANAWRP